MLVFVGKLDYKMSERSFTPPLPADMQTGDEQADSLSLEDQVKRLVFEMGVLKSQTKVRDVKEIFTWENTPDFDPVIKNISASKWIRLLEQQAYFMKWDDVATMKNAVNKLSGRAREWWLTSGFSGVNWTSFKKNFLEIYDIDPQSMGTIFKSAAMFASSDEPTLGAYFNKKLLLLNKLSWNIPECDKINIIISGISDPSVRQLAFGNNYKTLDDLMTFFRSNDFSRTALNRTSKLVRPGGSKIMCYHCQEAGHKKINCPALRPKPFTSFKNKSFANKIEVKPSGSNVCNFCKKRGHVEKDCFIKGNVSFVEKHATNLFYKLLYINNIALYGLIDTGSECSLVRSSVVTSYKFSPKTSKSQVIRTLSGEIISVATAIKAHIIMDELNEDEDFLIVPDSCCPAEILIGNTLIRRKNVGFVKVGSEIKFYQTPIPFGVNTVKKSHKNDLFQDLILGAGNKEVLSQTLYDFRDCIAFNLSELGRTNCTEMTIKLKTEEPVICNPYRLSEDRKKILRNMISELLTNQIIRESSSPYASPVVLIPKPDKTMRLCIDYRKINNITVKIKWPLPLIDDQIDKLCRYKMFTSLDLFSGYYQIPMAEDSIEKTAFITPDGKYEFLRMSFGLCNAPFVFQQMITKILYELPDGTAFGYIDDVIIPADSIETSLNKLKIVLTAFRKYNLTLQLKKCKFFMEKLNYLGREISGEGVRPDPVKVQALNNLSDPKNKKELQRFLGLSGYFRKFVKNYAQITSPLTQLLRNNIKWTWGNAQTKATAEIKTILISRPVLKIYDPALETQVHTDASSIALAGILIQLHADGPHPVAYFSKKCTYEQSRYHSYELETMAVVLALRHFRVYLLGNNFQVFTDCAAIRACATKKDLLPRIARWWLELQEYNFEVCYRPGHKMQHVDCLSRDIGEENYSVNCVTNLTELDWVSAVQSQDEEICKIIDILHSKKVAANKLYFDTYTLKGDILYRRMMSDDAKWVVPKASRWLICRLNHDECGHLGVEKTLERIKRNYWFAQMNRFVKKYIQSCLNCLYMKSSKGPRPGYLHPIPKSSTPFETLHIDHLGPFIKTKKGNTFLLVMVDGFTKFIFLEPVKSTMVKYVVKALKHFIYIFGVPTRMISDRGSCFTSKTMKLFCEEVGMKHVLNAVATPRANGQCERFNATILDALKCLSINDPNETSWDKHIPAIQLALNTSVNKTTGVTPCELLMGMTPKHPADARILQGIGSKIEQCDLQTLREKVENLITEAQRKDKAKFDAKRARPKLYKKSDLVLVKITSEAATGQSRKLQPAFKGPFKVTSVLPNDRYVVEDLREHGKRYKTVVAVDHIKPWVVLNAEKDVPFHMKD